MLGLRTRIEVSRTSGSRNGWVVVAAWAAKAEAEGISMPAGSSQRTARTLNSSKRGVDSRQLGTQLAFGHDGSGDRIWERLLGLSGFTG